jgi:hypothetical protein
MMFLFRATELSRKELSGILMGFRGSNSEQLIKEVSAINKNKRFFILL